MSDTVRIEMRSILKLTDYLTRNDRLVPDIRENDKTPSWDGDIFVYKSKSTAKDNMLGKVPVQVKGTYQEDLSGNMIKFSMDVSDLCNYLSSNGVIIFVVYMKGFEECKIYYNALLPFDLVKLIDKAGENAKKTIDLTEFPKDDSIEIINIFLNFIQDQKLQGGTVDSKILSLSDLSKSFSDYDGLRFSYTGLGLNNLNDVIKYSFKHHAYIYVKPKGFNIRIPVEKIITERVSTEVITPVKVDGSILYDKYKITFEKEKQITHIGKGFDLNFNTGSLDYKISGALSERITDMKFLLALVQNRSIEINGLILPDRTISFTTEEINEQKYCLKELEEVKKALDILGVKEDLQMDNLSDKEANELYLLVRAVLYNEASPFANENHSVVGTLTIGNLAISIALRETAESKIELSSFFTDQDFFKCTPDDDENEYDVSPYIILKKNDLLSLSNINYFQIVKSIEAVPNSEAHNSHTNQLFLEMIKAYDEQKVKNPELLKTAQTIVDILINNETNDPTAFILNKYQAIKRERDLNPEEIQEILEIKHNSTDEAVLTGASILLESFIEAQLHYNNLSEEYQKEFNTYPIVNLWKGKY